MMRGFRDVSVRVKLLLASIVPAAVSILVVALVIGVYVRAQFREESVESLTTVATIIGDNAAASLVFVAPEDAVVVLGALKARASIVSAAVYDSYGQLFATYAAPDGSRPPPPPSVPEDGSGLVGGDLVVTQPIMLGGRRVGTTYIVSDMREMGTLTRRIVVAESIVILLALLVALGVSVRLRNLLLKPISKLSKAAHTVSERGDYSVRVKLHGDDEFGRLAVAFNEMLDAIDQHDEAQRKSAAEWQSLVDNAVDLITIVDREHRVVSTNRVLPGRSSEDVVGVKVELLVVEEHSDRVREAVDHVLATGKAVSYEADVRLPDGRLYSYASVVSPILRDGEVDRVTLISRDVTDQLKLEEQLRQAQKMEAVGQLTGGVAHDFNNLLTVILGNLELLRSELDPNDPVTAFAQSATEAGTRAAALTQRLLAFSRKQALSPEVIDLSQLVSGMTDLLRRTLGETVTIETVSGAGLWKCEADPTQMENVLLNLAINARDAMPEGGTLTIESTNARLDAHYAEIEPGVAAGDYVLLVVTDTGDGMSAEVLQQVFDPFFTTKEVGRGSGLGLSMVYGFVKQSGGHVRIYSEVGVGASVKIFLPRTPDATPQVSLQITEDEPRGEGQLVLVVEDDPGVRRFSVTALQRLGYGTVEASDASVAIEMLEQNPDLALVFTDVVLPGGTSGVDLARQVRQRWSAVPVLLTSGYTEHTVLGQVPLDSGNELIQKPFTVSLLAQRVHKALATT